MNKKELNRIKNFHGHLGPYVILGYKMGKLAEKKIKKIKKIIIYLPKNPPQSCIIDGLQLSTNCTFGKNQIKIIKKKNFQKALFYNNHKITLELTQLSKKIINNYDIKKIINTPLNKLFIIN